MMTVGSASGHEARDGKGVLLVYGERLVPDSAGVCFQVGSCHRRDPSRGSRSSWAAATWR